jgi:FKBP-type peptidyl-prolyl cis-trans isomerase FklB
MQILKKVSLGLYGLVLLGASLSSLQVSAQENGLLHDDTDRLSYALGMDLGQQMHRMDVAVKPEIFAKGMHDGIAGGQTLMSHEEARASITALQDELKRRETAKAMLHTNQKAQENPSSAPVHP